MGEQMPKSTMTVMLSIAGAIILMLGTAFGSVVAGWAQSVEQRGIDNQKRITQLESQLAAFSAQQAYMIDLLKQHMAVDKR